MPPRNRRRKSIDVPFLFVNEDADTVTRAGKDTERDREKQSHVQRRGFARRQQLVTPPDPVIADPGPQSTSRVEESDPGASAPLTHQQRSLSCRSSLSTPSARRDISDIQNRAISDFVSVLGPASSEDRQSVYHYHHYPQQPPTPAQYSQLVAQSNARIALANPLRSTTPHPLLSDRYQLLQKWTPSLLRYFTTVLLPEKFYADARVVSMSEMRHARYIHNELQDLMSSPAHAYAALAVVSLQMLKKEGRLLRPTVNNPNNDESFSNLPSEDDARIPELFKAHAITAVRNDLVHNPLTPATVNDVLNLMGAAYHSNNFEAARPHYQALLRMINALGGLSAFSPYFTERVFLLHWSASLKMLSRPTLPVTSFDPGVGPVDVQATVARLRQNSPLMTRLTRLTTQPLTLSADLLSLAHSIANVIVFSRHAEKQAVYDPAHFRWIGTRHVALGYHLLGLQPDVMYGKINEAIRIALIFSTALTRSPRSGQSCASGSVGVPRLEELLKSSIGGNEDGESRTLWSEVNGGTEALLWVAVVGGVTAYKRNPELRAWFRRLAQECADVLLSSAAVGRQEDCYQSAATSSISGTQQGSSRRGDWQQISTTNTSNASTTYLGTPLELDIGAGNDFTFTVLPSTHARTSSLDRAEAATAANDSLGDYIYDYDDAIVATEQMSVGVSSAHAETPGRQALMEPYLDVNEEEGEEDAAWEADVESATPGSESGRHGTGDTALGDEEQGEDAKEEWQRVQDILLGFIWDVELEGGPLRVFWGEHGGT